MYVSESLHEFQMSAIERFGAETGEQIAEAIRVEHERRINEGVAALTLGTVLAMPAIIKIIATAIKTGAKLFKWKGGEQGAEKLSKFADKFHHKLIQPITWVLKKIPGMDEAKAEKWAKGIHTLIVALLGVYSGLETVEALKAANVGKSTFEGMLTAIKGTETGQALLKTVMKSA